MDPNDNDVLYFAAPGGHGLRRSTMRGHLARGDHAPDPSDPTGHQSDIIGVMDRDLGLGRLPRP